MNRNAAEVRVLRHVPGGSDESLLWPPFTEPEDVATVEAVALADRGVPPTCYAALERAASLWPDRPAVTVLAGGTDYADGATRTYAALFSDVRRCANGLTGLGASRSSAIGILSPNSTDLITALLAAETVGIAVPVNPGLRREHIAELFTRAGVDIIIAAGPDANREIWQLATGVAADVGATALLSLGGDESGCRTPTLDTSTGLIVESLQVMMSQQGADLMSPPPQGPDLAAFFHTGGTTGAPKLAAHRHAAQLSDAWMIACADPLPDDAVLFGALPLFHVNALVVTILAPMLRGQHAVWAGPLGYRDPALIAHFWRVVERHRIATMSAVPTVYAALSRVDVDADITSLRYGIVGASPLPGAVQDDFLRAAGVPLCEGYGLTEATCASARSFVSHPRPGWVGQRLPYQEVRVVAPEQNSAGWTDVEEGQAGLLLLKGPNTFAGYVVGRKDGLPVLDYLGTVTDGWLNTGDLGRVDKSGFIQLCGRAKDLIIRGGHNIDPAVIENALLEHPAVTAAGAVGRPDRHSGEVPVAYVTLHPESSAGTAELMSWAREHVGENAAVPKQITIVASIPLTVVGKPDKVALRVDATRAAAAAALREVGVAGEVNATAVDGVIAVTVTMEQRSIDAAAVARALAGFTFAWRIVDDEQGAQ